MDAVTGAFGYTGRYIARRLIAGGRRIRTLTGRSGDPGAFGVPMERAPLDFADVDGLTRSLQGIEVLYNTYWIRFARGSLTHHQAVENSRNLFTSAQRAGVRRVVHISITNADSTSRLPYFWGKGLVEEALRSTGMSHAILRPTIIFGREDILLNNIAWFLRRSPVFPIPGDGRYPVQPVFVGDLANLAVSSGSAAENMTIDAVGPETCSYEAMVRLIRDAAGSRARLVHTPPGWVRLGATLAGLLLGDVVLTAEEIKGLSAGLLVSHGPPTTSTTLSDWLLTSGGDLGRTYSSELARHYQGESGR